MQTTEEKLAYRRDYMLRWSAARKASDPDGWRAHRREIQRRYRAKHPEQYRAHTHVDNAKRAGRLTPATECGRCGNGGLIQASHDDYSQLLTVEWLCVRCHATKDRLARAGRNDND